MTCIEIFQRISINYQVCSIFSSCSVSLSINYEVLPDWHIVVVEFPIFHGVVVYVKLVWSGHLVVFYPLFVTFFELCWRFYRYGLLD